MVYLVGGLYLSLFFLDFLVFSLCHQWLLHSVFVYFLVSLLVTDRYDFFSVQYFPPFLFLLLEDCFLHGRFGLLLLVMVPLAFVAKEVKYTFVNAFYLFFPLFLGFFVVINDVLINTLVVGRPASFPMTIEKFFANFVVGIIIFVGLRGNRSFAKKERKVWTPNRQDASRA